MPNKQKVPPKEPNKNPNKKHPAPGVHNLHLAAHIQLNLHPLYPDPKNPLLLTNPLAHPRHPPLNLPHHVKPHPLDNPLLLR